MRIVLYFKKLNIGGAERSTVRLLNAFVDAGMDVTLFVWTKGGKLEKELSPKVKIRYLFHDTGVLDEWDRTKLGLLHVAPRKLINAAFQYVVGNIKRVLFRIFRPRFDLAITGWHGYDPWFLNRYTRSDVHFQMVRSENAIIFNGKLQPFVYKCEQNLSIVDAYVCVSEQLSKTMLNYCELPAERVITIYNIINIDARYEEDCEMPKEYLMCASDEIRITTICRLFDGAKGLLRMVDVCTELKRKKYRFKWFVVGDGSDREKMQAAIEDNDVSDCMILCGFRQNPVPYYMYADLVAVLSYMEGLCGTVNEAKLLKRPLIATRFSSIEEQICHGMNGHIVDNDKESILQGMELLLQDENYRLSLAVNGLLPALQDNDYKIEQFLQHFQRIKQGRIKH